jgi:hypothetical protein
MQIGCGVYEHTVRGKRYLYFWHYETQGGRRRQVTDYLGPAGSVQSQQEAAGRVDAYFARAAEALNRLRAETMEQLTA